MGKEHFQVEGLDISHELLEIARQRNPDVVLHPADMMDFDLGQRYDVVTCLFSSIGYVKTLDNLARAVGCMAYHLVPGGLLIIEPWFTPDSWRPGTVHAVFIDQPDLKVARINTSLADGRLSYFDLHYLNQTSTESLLPRDGSCGIIKRCVSQITPRALAERIIGNRAAAVTGWGKPGGVGNE